MIPRYFVLQSIFIFCPLILKFIFWVIFLFLDLKRTSSVVPVFNEILFALSHSKTFLFISLKDLLVYNIFVSSAK